MLAKAAVLLVPAVGGGRLADVVCAVCAGSSAAGSAVSRSVGHVEQGVGVCVGSKLGTLIQLAVCPLHPAVLALVALRVLLRVLLCVRDQLVGVVYVRCIITGNAQVADAFPRALPIGDAGGLTD